MKKTIYLIALILMAGNVNAKLACHAGFTIQANGLAVSFTDASTSTNTITSWQWDFGDGSTSTSQNPVHTYSVADTFHVCLTIHDDHGCTDTWCHSVIVTVVHPCHANFTFHATGLDVSFTDASTAGGAITSWQWDFGDGSTSTSQNPQHTYAVGDTFHVCLTIHDSHGCTDSYCHDVVVSVLQNCDASFTFHATGLDVSFTDASTAGGAITSWQWDFGDGSTSSSQNPQHTYAVGDTFHVCLTIHDSHGCSDTYCHDVIVSSIHPCHASFTFGVDSTGNVIHFTNTSTYTTGTTTYSWDFGDGGTSTLENPTYTYPHPGRHIVCLYISDPITGCSSHYCHVVFHGHVRHHHSHHSTARVSAYFHDDAAISIYPNPVRNSATIEYSLLESAVVTIEIYDLLGSKVLEQGQLVETEGQHSHLLNTSNLTDGFYLLKLTVNKDTLIRKISVLN